MWSMYDKSKRKRYRDMVEADGTGMSPASKARSNSLASDAGRIRKADLKAETFKEIHGRTPCLGMESGTNFSSGLYPKPKT